MNQDHAYARYVEIRAHNELLRWHILEQISHIQSYDVYRLIMHESLSMTFMMTLQCANACNLMMY